MLVGDGGLIRLERLDVLEELRINCSRLVLNLRRVEVFSVQEAFVNVNMFCSVDFDLKARSNRRFQ